jgi:peptidylprolyl isomerase
MMKTFSTLTLALSLALASGAALAADDAANAAGDAAKQAGDAAQKAADEAAIRKAIEEAAMKAMAQQGMAPPAANKIPVPDMPVVNKQEKDGLIIEDMKIGDGYEIKAGDSVVAHYHGTLKADGKVFDSSFERGEPAAFPLSGVIEGWQKGVPGMKVGGIRRLTIPYAMAYGEEGRPPTIPAKSDLVFVIQLEGALEKIDTVVGTGEEIGPRPVVVTAYRMLDKDGKEIESATKENPFIWVPGEHQAISMGLEGMRVGGKRTLKVPAQMNITTPGAPNADKRPSNVPATFEIEVLVVKNLVPVQPKAPAAETPAESK